MRRVCCAVSLFLLIPALAVAQTVAAQAPTAAPASPLPVTRVVLYKTGVGYFEHLGNVTGNENVTITFTSAQLDDVLKSMTAIDLGKGRITGISYNSIAPLGQQIGALRLPLSEHTSMFELLSTLRGARVEIVSPTVTATGRLLSTERETRTRGDATETVDTFSILTEAGELRSVELAPSVRVRVLERDLRQEIGRYLDLVGSTRERDVRSMRISSTGSGQRPLLVSYVSEVPIWKSTYRLVISDKSTRPLLQGWAIVDNTTGADWRTVELSLVAGAPQSFIQRLSQPYYSQRPVIPMPGNFLTMPQTHSPTLTSGGAVLRGRVIDGTGSPIPGALVTIAGDNGHRANVSTGADGSYELSAPSGDYDVVFTLQGFSTERRPNVELASGVRTEVNATLRIGSIQESVTVSALAAETGLRRGIGGGIGGNVAPPPPPPASAMPSPSQAYAQMKDVAPAAAARELGDLFEYRISEPVSLAKNQSALVPIVNAETDAEQVSLWSRGSGSGRPLRAVWLRNQTGLTLDGGSFTVVDGNAFAGEGLIEPIKPGERRLVSYATNLGMLVSARNEGTPARISRVRAAEGVLIQDAEERVTWTYSVRNEDAAAHTLILEHPIRADWKLDGAPAPDESTPTAQRFRVRLEAKGEATVALREVRAGASQMLLTEVTEAIIGEISARGIPAEPLVKALRPVLERRQELARVERQLNDLEVQRRAIAQDQQRLRENMKALRGSSEEKQLLQRYTRQLNEQEDRLASLQREVDESTKRRDAARAELAKLAMALSFDVTVP